MIEVVRRGKKPSEKKCEGTCHYCKTEVRFLVGDAIRESHDQRDGSTYVVKCPECGQEIYGYTS